MSTHVSHDAVVLGGAIVAEFAFETRVAGVFTLMLLVQCTRGQCLAACFTVESS